MFAVGGRDGNIYVCDIRENPAHTDGLLIECSGEIPQAHGSIGENFFFTLKFFGDRNLEQNE